MHFFAFCCGCVCLVFRQIVFIICTWGPPYRYCMSETWWNFASLFIFKCILQVLQFNSPRQGIPRSPGIHYYRWLNEDGSVYMTAGVWKWRTSTRTSKLEHFLTAVPLNPCKMLKSDSLPRWLKSPCLLNWSLRTNLSHSQHSVMTGIDFLTLCVT